MFHTLQDANFFYIPYLRHRRVSHIIIHVNKLHATSNVQGQSLQLTSHATAKEILKALLRNSVAKCRLYGSQCSTKHLIWAGRLKILIPNNFNIYTLPYKQNGSPYTVNPLNAELNTICYLLALLAHHFLHVSRIRVKSLTLRLLMSYICIWSAYS